MILIKWTQYLAINWLNIFDRVSYINHPNQIVADYSIVQLPPKKALISCSKTGSANSNMICMPFCLRYKLDLLQNKFLQGMGPVKKDNLYIHWNELNMVVSHKGLRIILEIDLFITFPMNYALHIDTIKRCILPI